MIIIESIQIFKNNEEILINKKKLAKGILSKKLLEEYRRRISKLAKRKFKFTEEDTLMVCFRYTDNG